MNNLSTTLWSHIRTVQDFPKPGICFFDLTPLFMSNIEPLTDALIASIPAEQQQLTVIKDGAESTQPYSQLAKARACCMIGIT
jgi:adenine/guanine phosphoribosyltransferase-like PRPP-binding protein